MTLKLTTHDMLIPAALQEPRRRFEIVPGAALHLQHGEQKISVIFGIAWISWQGQDFVVRQGESLSLRPDKYDAVISPLRGERLIFEVETPEK
jgi:hypothetical protein